MRLRPACVIVLAALILPATAALGDEQERLDEKLRLLEGLLDTQQEQIRTLENQVQIADDESLDQARVAEIKKLIREVLGDTDFRGQLTSTTLQAGYDKGFYIRSSDDDFELKIRLQTQFRYIGLNRQTDNPNVFGRQKRDDLSGFEWEKTRLAFLGHLFGKDLTYFLRFEGDTDGGNTVRVLDLWFQYAYAPGHKIRWGQIKVAQGAQFNDDDSVQQTVDRGIVSYTFALGRSLGLEALGVCDLGASTKLKYRVGVFNGFNNQADDVRDVDTNMALAARLALEIGSPYGQGAADLSFHEKPALVIGTHFAFNDDNNDTGGPALIFDVPDIARAGRGGIGAVDASGTQYYQFGLDAGFKYRGFSLSGEYAVRTVESETRRSLFQLASLQRGSTHVQGAFLQAGYFIIPRKFEAVGRVEGIWDNGGDNVWAYAAGANYYIKGQALKLSADITWTPESPVTASIGNYAMNDDMVLYRVQIQAGMQ